jgi:uncharacterized C2H2 Zn-finger protein
MLEFSGFKCEKCGELFLAEKQSQKEVNKAHEKHLKKCRHPRK